MATLEGTTTCGQCGLEFSGVALFCPNCGTPKSRDFDGDPLIGAVVGERFLIQERLGHGGSGTIYRASHTTLRRKVAVKVLHHELSRDDLAIERFRREATTVSEIDNEHIVEIHDFGRTTDGRLYLAMEFLDGETLDARLDRQKRLDVAEAADILIQLGDALIEAHAIGYIHRDLRPRNIFLANRRGRPNFVKLLDFGLAKLVEAEGEAATTSLGMTFGEPKYMSPEQARGDSVDRRADIYSMGCIAYEMLVGEPPFIGGRVFDILTRHVETSPKPLIEHRPETPQWLNVAVMRMLEKRAVDRFTTVYRLVEALRQGLETGKTMPASVARRRWTAPPPSVSREMQRLGMVQAADILDTERTAAPAMNTLPGAGPGGDTERTPYDPTKTVPAGLANRSEVHAAVANPAGASDAHDEDDEYEDDEYEDDEYEDDEYEDDEDLRQTIRRSDSDRLRAHTSPSGKGRPTERDSAGISAAWYADGEEDEAPDLDERQRQKLRSARAALAPSRTDISGSDLYFEPKRRPIVWIAGALGAAVLIIVVVVLASSGGGKKKTEPAPSASAGEPASGVVAAQPSDAGPVALAPVDGGAKPVKAAKPAASKAAKPSAVATARRPRPATRPRPTGTSPWPSMRPKPKPAVTPPVTKPTPPVTKPTPPAPKPNANKTKADFYAKIGKRALSNGDVLGAAKAFNDARKLDKNNADAITGLGEIALSQGAYTAAIGHLRRASKMRPGSARVHTLLGEAYLSSGRNKSAATAFKKALRLNPDNARARNGYNDASGRIPPPPEDAP